MLDDFHRKRVARGLREAEILLVLEQRGKPEEILRDDAVGAGLCGVGAGLEAEEGCGREGRGCRAEEAAFGVVEVLD